MTTQVRAKLFASIVTSNFHSRTGLRAWPCCKPSKWVVAGLAASSPTTWRATGSRRLRRLLNSSPLLLEMMVLCSTRKAALTLFACFFKLKLEFGCFARVPGVAEGGVCLYARNCQLRARQQFDSVVREAFSSITGLHHTPSVLLQRPLGSIQSQLYVLPPRCLNSQVLRPQFDFIFKFHTTCANSLTFRLNLRFIFKLQLPCLASQTFSLNLWFPLVWKSARYSSVFGGFVFGCHSGAAGVHLVGIPSFYKPMVCLKVKLQFHSFDDPSFRARRLLQHK